MGKKWIFEGSAGWLLFWLIVAFPIGIIYLIIDMKKKEIKEEKPKKFKKEERTFKEKWVQKSAFEKFLILFIIIFFSMLILSLFDIQSFLWFLLLIILVFIFYFIIEKLKIKKSNKKK